MVKRLRPLSRFERRLAVKAGLREALYGKGSPFLSSRDGSVISQRYFGIEAIGEHPLVIVNETIIDPHILQRETRQLSEEAIVLWIESGSDEVYQLDRAFLSRSGFEEFLFARSHRAILKLSLHDFEAFLDLRFVHRGAVASQRNSTT